MEKQQVFTLTKGSKEDVRWRQWMRRSLYLFIQNVVLFKWPQVTHLVTCQADSISWTYTCLHRLDPLGNPTGSLLTTQEEMTLGCFLPYSSSLSELWVGPLCWLCHCSIVLGPNTVWHLLPNKSFMRIQDACVFTTYYHHLWPLLHYNGGVRKGSTNSMAREPTGLYNVALSGKSLSVPAAKY